MFCILVLNKHSVSKKKKNPSEIFHVYISYCVHRRIPFVQICALFCIVVYRMEIALARTLIKTEKTGFDVSILIGTYFFIVLSFSLSHTLSPWWMPPIKVVVLLILVCLTLHSGGKAGCKYEALRCSWPQILELASIWTHYTLHLVHSSYTGNPLHHHPGGSLLLSCIVISCFLCPIKYSVLVYFFILGKKKNLLIAFYERNLWEVNSLRTDWFENIFRVFLFLIGSLPGYWILCWKLFFFRTVKASIQVSVLLFRNLKTLFLLTGVVKYLLLSANGNEKTALLSCCLGVLHVCMTILLMPRV